MEVAMEVVAVEVVAVLVEGVVVEVLLMMVVLVLPGSRVDVLVIVRFLMVTLVTQ